MGLKGGHGDGGTADGKGGMTSSELMVDRIFREGLREGERGIGMGVGVGATVNLAVVCAMLPVSLLRFEGERDFELELS